VVVRLLGPVDLLDGARVVHPGGHARTLLAALAVRAGVWIGRDSLIWALWGDDTPRTAEHALHVHVSSLRKLLPVGLSVEARRGGYALAMTSAELDVDRFERFAASGRAALASGDTESATTALRSALELWRGPSLADVPWERFAEGDVRRWEALHHSVEEDLVDALLAGGHHVEAIGEGEKLVAEQPFREHRWAQLMVALYRAGRQAEALDRYGAARTKLAAELGVEPSPELRDLAERIRSHDVSLAPAGTTTTIPVTRFARGPGGRLAYQVIGDGPVDLVFIPGFGGNVEIRWEHPSLARLFGRLAASARVILLDKRGTGLSDRDGGIPPLEDNVDDVLAVMSEARAARAVLVGVMDGGAIALLAAAGHPDRVQGVVTYASFAAFELLGPDAHELFDAMRAQLDRGVFFEEMAARLAPSHAGDPAFTRWMGRYLRLAAGLGGAAALLNRMERLDIRTELPGVAVPVLALHRTGDRLVPAANADFIAAHVQRGRSVLLPGDDSVIWAGDVDAIAAEIEGLLAEI
jgi:DNA-binding SARP family transcriptional activator/pimeloyl-ACP methyl ester carboxylesterase